MERHLILLASGAGSRFGTNVPKQFVKINGRMIIEYTMAASDCGMFDEMILVVSSPYVDLMESVARSNQYKVPVRVVEGGSCRKESCERGVAAIQDENGFVVIHNSVQPFITEEDYRNSIVALEKYPAVTSGVPCVYTILETDGDGVLRRMAPRAQCFGDLGPECFWLPVIRKALELGRNDSEFTNLTGLVMKYGLGDIYVVKGSPRNIKITYPEDVIYAERMINGK